MLVSLVSYPVVRTEINGCMIELNELMKYETFLIDFVILVVVFL